MEPDPGVTSWVLAGHDAARALRQYDAVRSWLDAAAPPAGTPVAVEVWVYSADLSHVVLVHHRWRGWVPPGGKVEPGEHPREAAAREVLEETGLVVTPDPTPAASAVRAFRADWSPTLALSYWVVVDRQPLRGEDDQPPAWTSTAAGWSSCFPEDAQRVQKHADWLARRRRPAS